MTDSVQPEARVYGIDVSHFQAPRALPWDRIAAECGFMIAKFSDGIVKDAAAVEHARRARTAGLVVGGYHFFRDTVSVSAQFDAFCSAAADCGLAPGDLFPALDVEDWPIRVPARTDADWHRISHATSEPARQWCELAKAKFGGAIVYTSQRDWGRLGSPAWVLDFPLWCAHYPGHEIAAPATPDHRPWRIWQFAVHPLDFKLWANDTKNPRAIDHDWARLPLPTIPRPNEVVPDYQPPAHEPSYVTDVNWSELRAGRDVIVSDD